jgi:hypothetical protein
MSFGASARSVEVVTVIAGVLFVKATSFCASLDTSFSVDLADSNTFEPPFVLFVACAQRCVGKTAGSIMNAVQKGIRKKRSTERNENRIIEPKNESLKKML